MFSPAALFLGQLVAPYCALFSVVACALSVHVLYLGGGFPLLRFPAALWGLTQIVLGGLLLLRHLF